MDSKYFTKLVQYIYYWQSDLFTDCKHDALGNKMILIDSSITKDESKFLRHIKIYIDSTRELKAHDPCGFPLVSISNDYKYIKIEKHFTQKTEYICPFVIHNPNPKIKITPTIDTFKPIKQNKKQNGQTDQLLFQ